MKNSVDTGTDTDTGTNISRVYMWDKSHLDLLLDGLLPHGLLEPLGLHLLGLYDL